MEKNKLDAAINYVSELTREINQLRKDRAELVEAVTKIVNGALVGTGLGGRVCGHCGVLVDDDGKEQHEDDCAVVMLKQALKQDIK